MQRKFLELTQQEQDKFLQMIDIIGLGSGPDVKFAQTRLIGQFGLSATDPIVLDILLGAYQPNTDNLVSSAKKAIVEPAQAFDSVTTKVTETQTLNTLQLTESNPQLPADSTQSKKPTWVKTYANSAHLIVIQNRLLHAISHLTLNERRLILFLSPIVRKQMQDDPNNRIFHVAVKDFVNEYNIKSNNYYSELEKIADSIVEKAFFFWYDTESGHKAKKGVSWVSECDYLDNEGKLKIKLDDTVIEMLTVFDKATGKYWTTYQKEWIINLGTYGIIMLELVLSSLEFKGTYSLEHLRQKFDCVTTYPKFGNFRIYVIDNAINEIHKHTPIRISYQVHKTGKAVTSLTFSYTDTSKSKIEQTDDDGKDTDNLNTQNTTKDPFYRFKMTDKQLSLFATKIAKALNKDVQLVAQELQNIHLQGQYVDLLKMAEFVPSQWYNDKEASSHLTAEQITKLNQTQADKEKQDNDNEQARFEQEYQYLLEHAEQFVTMNLDKIKGNYLAQLNLGQGNYRLVVSSWQRELMDPVLRRGFKFG